MHALATLPVSAADGPVELSGIEVGFDGAVKIGRWTPIAFDVSGNPGAKVETTVTAPDPDGSETTWNLPPLVLDESGHGRAVGLFKIGRLEGTIRVAADRTSLTIPAAPAASSGESACRLYTQDVPFVGVFGTAPGFDAAFADKDAEGNPVEPVIKGRLIKFETADALPKLDAAYDSLDVLVLSQSFEIPEPRSNAIANWVRLGGHAVLALGDNPQSFTASPVSSWAPVSVNERSQFRELAALLSRVPGPPLTITTPVAGVRVRPQDGIDLAGSLVSGALATRSPYGTGQVTVLAVDWNDARIAKWPALPLLCRNLADLEPESRDAKGRGTATLRPTGISELATQLAALLDHFSSVHRPSYWTVILFALAFMLLVGPLDYLLVHRVLKQPRLTWFTFPCWTLFAAAAATMGADRLNSADRQANQFDLLDIDAVSGETQLKSWATIYSPEPRRFRIAAQVAGWLRADDAARRMLLGWSGAPEPGFGGMYRAGGLNLANPPYSIDSRDGAGVGIIENVPIGKWSSRAFSADWHSGLGTGSALVTSQLEDDGAGQLTGSFTHRLPESIVDYCIAYGAGAYFPRAGDRVDQSPAIVPGVPWSPADRVSRRKLDNYLQGLTERYNSNAKVTGSATTMTMETYDPLGLDPFPVARILTFFDAGRGHIYTGLSNDSLERYDLSRLLPLKRAVLFGRIASPAATYDVDGTELQPQEHWTYVRIVLPVKPGIPRSLRERGELDIRN